MPSVKSRTGAQDPMDVLIGLNIRMNRQRVGMSDQKLGDAVGVTYQQIQKYEHGINRVSAATLVRIAHELKVPTSALLVGVYKRLNPATRKFLKEEAALVLHTQRGITLFRLISKLSTEQMRPLIDHIRKLARENENS